MIFHDTRNPDEPGVRLIFDAIREKTSVADAMEIRSMDGSPKGRGIGVIQLPVGEFKA